MTYNLSRMITPYIIAMLIIPASVFLSSNLSITMYLLFGITVIYFLFLILAEKRIINFVILLSLLNGVVISSSPLLNPHNFSIIIGLIGYALIAMKKRYKLIGGSEAMLILLFLCYSTVISFLESSVLSQSINGLFQIGLAIGGFFLVLQSSQNNVLTPVRIIKTFCVFLFLESVFGVISFILYMTTSFNLGGVQFGQVFGSVTVKGTLLEANLFGALMSVGIVMILALKLDGHLRKKWWYIALLNMAVALLLSWTRSAWIGLIIGLIIIGIYFRKKLLSPKNQIIVLVGSISFLAFVFIAAQQIDTASNQEGLFLSKFDKLFDSDSGTALYRVNQYELAFSDLKNHELFGKGYFSIKEYGEKAWISNMFLFILHDTGIIGLLIFISLLLLVLFKLIKALMIYQDNSGYLIGMLSGLVIFLFTFNFTPAHTLSFFWIYLGLCIALYNQVRNDNYGREQSQEDNRYSIKPI